MRKHSKFDHLNSSHVAALAIIILLVVSSLIWSPFSNKDVLEGEENNSIQPNSNEETLLKHGDLDIIDEDEIILESDANELSKKELGKNDLCEEYLFNEGDKLKIVGHEILIEAIGSTSIKLDVDGNKKILGEGENNYFKSGITIGLNENGIFYYGVNSEHNSVELMVGCDYGDNPNDKYIKSKGEQYCKTSYDSCIALFE